MKKKNIQRIDASKILAPVSRDEAFHFHTDFGAYTEKFATSLVNFCEMLEIIDLKAIEFHVEREDFEKWIRHLGDYTLAAQVGKLRERKIKGEDLRRKLIEIIKRRINKLRSMLRQS